MQAMSYDTIIEIILNSDPEEDWEKSSHANSDGFECHFHRDDVNIRFEREMDNEGFATMRDFKADWTDKFPNRDASCSGFRLYYASTLIKTFLLVAVNGERARLPIPMDDETTVSRLNYKVAQIHDTFDSLDEYMKIVNFTVSPE